MSSTTIDKGNLLLWTACAVLAIGVHVGGGVGLGLGWGRDQISFGDDSDAVVVDLAPFAPPSESVEDVAPGPVQQLAAAPAPEQQAEPKPEEKPDEKVEPKPPEKVEEKVEAKVEPKAEEKPEEKIEVPPAPVPPVAAIPPPPEAVEPPPPPPEPQAQPVPPSNMPPAPATTAPPRPHTATAAETNAWHKAIFACIQRNKDYPAPARARGEKGVVQIAFSIDRQGHLITSRIAQASGHELLDRAAMETIHRAQPCLPASPDLPGEAFNFTVPVAFSIR
jgi:protein TonB